MAVMFMWQAFPTVNSLEFELHPNSAGHIDICTFTNETGDGATAGEGEVVLKIR
jgi:hypothetical protein